MVVLFWVVFFFKQKTAYEMRISDWSSDVCSSDLAPRLCMVPRIPTDSAPVWHRLCQRDLHYGCMVLVKAAFTSAGVQPLSAVPPTLNFCRRQIGRAHV